MTLLGVDQELLRRAGEHLGALAEREREVYDLTASGAIHRRSERWDRYAKLARLSREVLEIVK